MTKSELMGKYLRAYNSLKDIIWLCPLANNPIYKIDEAGNRVPQDLYQIQKGFAKAYNELYDEGIRIK